MSAARRSTIRLTGRVALVALTAGLLAGCTASAASGGGSGSSDARPPAGYSAGGTAVQDASGGATASGGGATAVGKAPTSAADRSIVRTGSLELTAKNPIRTAAAITSIVIGSGGRVDTVAEDPTGDASSSLTARIPADVFDATLTRIKREGTVRTVSLRGTDVTSQVTDFAVRIKGLRTSIDRLQDLLAKASTTTDLVQIESTLTTRETDLERLLAQQQALTDQVSYATLSITVHEPSLARNAPPSTFLTGLAAGWEALVAVGASLTVGLGVVLPWLLALAAVGAVVLLVARVVRRVRRPAAPTT